MMKPIFITGIGTDIGKTITSAVLVEKMRADYWKPVQAGDLHNSDTIKVRQLVANPVSVFHPEAYGLSQPFSPHKAAALDGIEIDMDKIILPKTANQLIIEGAGGLMVPLNDRYLIIDLIKKLDAEVILVSKNYLGSINHTLLSAEALKQRNIPVKGIIFNGEPNENTEQIILSYTKLKLLGHIPLLSSVNKDAVAEIAGRL